MAKRLKCDELKERVAALEKENRQLREGLARTEVLFDGKEIEEELLRRGEERFRILADLIYDWEMWLSPSGDYLYISPSCERITGYLAEEFMKDPSLFWRILHPDDLPRMEKHRRDVAEGSGQIYSIDFRLVNRRGEERWINHHCQPVYGRDMRFLGRRISNRDITERKQAEEALRESNANLRALIDNPVDSILLVNPDGIVLEANQTFAQRVGRRVDELIGRCVYDFFRPELAKRRRAHVDEVVRLGVLVRFEDERAGMWLDHTVHPVFDAQGRVVRVAIIAHDITDHKRIENELRMSEERYRRVVEDQTEVICRFREDGTFTFVNEVFCRFLGKSSDEFIGKKWQAVANEEDWPLIEAKLRSLSSVDPVVVLENRVTSPDSQIYWMQFVNRAFFDGEGRLLEIQAVGRDITDRKRTEEKLQETQAFLMSLLDNTPALVHIKTLDNRYSLVNRSWERFTGKTAQEVLGRRPTDLFPSATARKFHAAHRKVIDTKAPVAVEQVVWRGNKEFHFHTTLFPLIDADGEIRFIGGISVDISDLKHAEEQLRETREQLFQSQKMETLGTLVAGVAHEINNPISLVLFDAPLLRKIWSDLQPVIERHADADHQTKYAGLSYEYLKNNLDRLLADMELAGNRIAAIVNHLKEFARRSDISEKNPLSLNEAIENALSFSQTSVRKAGVRLNVALGTDLPSMIGNMQRIEQVVLNILVNAVQAIKHKQGLIEIKTSYDEPRGGVTLSVSDNGEGIDPSKAGRIFDPFYTTRQGEGGTGLGLSVTYNLVKEHHGRITFESEVGKGTTFKVFFPLRAEKKRLKVLAIDDEDSFLEILKNAFGKLSSFDLEIAQSRMDVLIKILTFHPDILILDLMMPDMDGLELCRELRGSPELAHMEVVVVTGFWEDAKLETIRELGFTRIYRKPLDLEAFIKEIEKMV